MDIFRLITQIILLCFMVFIIGNCIYNRNKYREKYEFWTNLIATIILTAWLLMAGSFDRFIW